jgi:hypothetical protein
MMQDCNDKGIGTDEENFHVPSEMKSAYKAGISQLALI